MPITLELLKKTSILELLNTFKEHGSAEITRKGKQLRKHWRKQFKFAPAIFDVPPDLPASGDKIELLWPDDGKWYGAQVMMMVDQKRATVVYAADGAEETLDLTDKKNKWRKFKAEQADVPAAAPAVAPPPPAAAPPPAVAMPAPADGGGAGADPKSRKKARKALVRLLDDIAVADAVEKAIFDADGQHCDVYKEALALRTSL